jgi:acyl-CoA thioesterase I
MRRHGIFGLLAVSLALASSGCEERQAWAMAAEEAAYEGTIVAVGDSLTAGQGVPEKDAYPARLQKRLLSEGYRYKVINAGISGETSSGALSRIKWVVTTLKPDIVIFETGANDGFRGIKTDLVESNINEAIRILKEHKVTVVLAGMQMVGNLGASYTTAFKGIYPRVAKQQGVILIPFFLDSVAGDPRLNQPDGIHPTSEAYGIVTNTVTPYVIEAIKQSKSEAESQGDRSQKSETHCP